MAHLRFEALRKLSERSRVHVDNPTQVVSKFFRENVYGIEEMRATLAPAVYKKVSQAIKNHEKIDETTADAVASAAKSWAMAKGATHFTHWFQPMTGGTAEKHDSFFDAVAGIE
jgi:glutamine synthetase